MDSTSTKTPWQVAQPFVTGGLGGMIATAVIQPVDMIKVRMQLAGEGVKNVKAHPFRVAGDIIRQESFRSLYNGLSAGLLRQATYTTARMGLFNTFLAKAREYNGANQPVTFLQRSLAGLAAGGLGAIVGTPADLALVRMQSDGTLPVAKRSNYTGVTNALVRITREEGVLALWNGAGPTVARAMALNLGMLTSYSHTKHELDRIIGPGPGANFGASAVAGFFASALSLPFDFIKTRLQKQRPDAEGRLPYKGSIDCAIKVVKNEGPWVFYRTFPVYYLRIAPHAMLTLLVADGLTSMAQTFMNNQPTTSSTPSSPARQKLA
ncbi:putative mitochondrial 2-oxoglutarate/malate carrier protein-like protein [Fimicolochytrium jonesii]|uniref:putative mitochondrial 2-oxoglutarate/malate carrier protein-like protein n=1 Tax=Fimicolochytrium jonesii TaxID=1396493 RepID=UPI0022FF41B1|nr:putative mitochondrial 2-oxoglutarate/malate carrier protein-like protein [Fimicolochytrium jonesii]KAI8821490.1 putative mitochondrial 2-oxoglutarate/malate carrier protein-like protein [Fimicolochytrium jonesii]